MKKNILLLFIFCLPIFIQAQFNTWIQKMDFSAGKRERAVAFSIGNFGYVCAGIDTSETLLKDLWQYNPTMDTWTQKANLPGVARRDAVAFSINGKAYVGTGIDNVNALLGNKLKDIWEYTPTLNNWTQKADFPGSGGNGIYFASAFSVDSKGYICGGKWGPSLYSSQLWEYKPSSNLWMQRANFPAGVRYQMSSFTIGNQAYVGLGANQDVYKKDFYRYNPGSNQWTQIADLIGSERGSACAFSLENRGFICLGTNGGLLGDLLEYNPELNEWEVRCAYGGSKRKNALAFVVNGRAFVGLGKGYSGKKASMHEYAAANYAGMKELTAQWQLYPNPSNGMIYLEAAFLFQAVRVINSIGSICLDTQIQATSHQIIDLSNLPTGIYQLRLTSTSGQFFQKQIIIE